MTACSTIQKVEKKKQANILKQILNGASFQLGSKSGVYFKQESTLPTYLKQNVMLVSRKQNKQANSPNKYPPPNQASTSTSNNFANIKVQLWFLVYCKSLHYSSLLFQDSFDSLQQLKIYAVYKIYIKKRKENNSANKVIRVIFLFTAHFYKPFIIVSSFIKSLLVVLQMRSTQDKYF